MPKKKSKPAEDEGPKKKVMYTIKLDDEKMDQLADLLEEKSVGGAWFPYDVAYSLFAFKGEKVNVVVATLNSLVLSEVKVAVTMPIGAELSLKVVLLSSPSITDGEFGDIL